MLFVTIIVVIALVGVALYVNSTKKRKAADRATPDAAIKSSIPPKESKVESSPPAKKRLDADEVKPVDVNTISLPPKEVSAESPLPASTNKSLLFHLPPDGLAPTLQFYKIKNQQCICEQIVPDPAGEGMYLSVHREKVNFTNLYDLRYVTLDSGQEQLLADLGSDSSYYSASLNDYFFRTTSVVHYETHRLLCLKNGRTIPVQNGSFEMESVTKCRNGLLLKRYGQLYQVTPEKVVGSIELDRNYFSLPLTHPDRNLMLFDYKKYDAAKGKVDYQELSTYYLMEYDDQFRIISQQKILKEQPDKKYDSFISGRSNEILFIEAVDTNGDGIADYSDEHNERIQSIDLQTKEIRTVIDQRMDIRSFQFHPDGFIFFTNETIKDKEMQLILYNLNTGKKTILATLYGKFFNFGFNHDWTRLFFQKVLDTTGRGNFYIWEDESELYAVDLLAENQDFYKQGMARLKDLPGVTPVQLTEPNAAKQPPMADEANPDPAKASDYDGTMKDLFSLLEGFAGEWPKELDR
ncbi:MAG: hypothetical protein GX556_13825, partial [Fibrobacter sp.]|nr:hypothetical protein [Fibrobacter sp.]